MDRKLLGELSMSSDTFLHRAEAAWVAPAAAVLALECYQFNESRLACNDDSLFKLPSTSRTFNFQTSIWGQELINRHLESKKR